MNKLIKKQTETVMNRRGQDMAQLKILTLNDWTRVLSEQKPILVDFQAPWCPPAMLQREAFIQLAMEAGDRIEMYHLDASRFLPIAMTYRLFDFPALLLFKDGKLVKAFMGESRVDEMKKYWKLISGRTAIPLTI